MVTAGIDIGKGYVKFYTEDKQEVYPSHVAEGYLSDIDGVSLVVGYRGRYYVVGTDACFGRMDWELRDYKSGIHTLIHVLYLVAKHFPQEEEFMCAVGLPTGNYESEKAQLKRLLEGRHTYEAFGEQRSVLIECFVVPEGVGAYCDHILDNSGNIKETELLNMALVVDIGYKTVDSVVVGGVKIGAKGWQSAFLGVEGVVDTVVSELTTSVGILTPEERMRVKESLMNGAYTVFLRGKAVDISATLEAACQRQADAIKEYVEALTRKTAVERIFFAGGGSILLAEYLRREYPHAVFQNDIFSNARGFYKMLKRKLHNS